MARGRIAPDRIRPLVEAVLNHQLETARLLLERGASQHNLCYWGALFSPLDYARENGHRDMVELLEGYLA